MSSLERRWWNLIIWPYLSVYLIGIKEGGDQFNQNTPGGVKMSKNKILVAVVLLTLAVTLTACRWPWQKARPTTSEAVMPWWDEDGYAVVGDTSTPRLYSWIADFIREEYGVSVQDHGSWMQATLPNGLIVSWAEWGEPVLSLGAIDGLYEGKALFVAMRDYSPWVNDERVQHVECSGSYIPSYNSSMSRWDVHYSTIIQFDNDGSAEFVQRMTNEWNSVRLAYDECP
jgi:hypothetical protein